MFQKLREQSYDNGTNMKIRYSGVEGSVSQNTEQYSYTVWMAFITRCVVTMFNFFCIRTS
jgi:hypothetical protein